MSASVGRHQPIRHVTPSVRKARNSGHLHLPPQEGGFPIAEGREAAMRLAV